MKAIKDRIDYVLMTCAGVCIGIKVLLTERKDILRDVETASVEKIKFYEDEIDEHCEYLNKRSGLSIKHKLAISEYVAICGMKVALMMNKLERG